MEAALLTLALTKSWWLGSHLQHPFSNCPLLALYGGGRLCIRFPSQNENSVAELPWLHISHDTNNRFDDIIICEKTIWALDRQGVIHSYRIGLDLSKTTIKSPIAPACVKKRSRRGLVESSQMQGWRKRLVESLDGEVYMIVRTSMENFNVYQLIKDDLFYWDEVYDFEDQVLFMARDYCFFTSAIKSHGCQLMNCIIFCQSAFPIYGINGWKFPPSCDGNSSPSQSQDDMAIFQWTNEGSTFAWDGENRDLSKIKWKPPSWVLHDALSLESQSQSESSAHSQSESHSKPDIQSESEREFEDEELESDGNNQDEEDEEMQSEGSSQDEEVKEIQFDANSQDQEEPEVQCNLNCHDGSLLHKEVSPYSFGAASKEQTIEVASTSAARGESVSTPVVDALAHVAGEASSEYFESQIPRKDVKHTVSRAHINPVIESNGSDTSTVKFEGFDIRSDLISTLQSIWSKHGNIVENCFMRSRKTVAALLESLASMVIVLEGNSLQSLIDSQVPDDLSDTLSDLRIMGIKVDWLIPYVEKAVLLHKCKLEVNSLNKLNQLRAQAIEQRLKLLSEVNDVDKQLKELDEEMARLSKVIPVCGQIILDKPLGAGLS